MTYMWDELYIADVYFIFLYQTGRQYRVTPAVIHIPSASDSRPTHNGISVQRYSSSDDSDHRDHENANVSAGYVRGINFILL